MFSLVMLRVNIPSLEQACGPRSPASPDERRQRQQSPADVSWHTHFLRHFCLLPHKSLSVTPESGERCGGVIHRLPQLAINLTVTARGSSEGRLQCNTAPVEHRRSIFFDLGVRAAFRPTAVL